MKVLAQDISSKNKLVGAFFVNFDNSLCFSRETWWGVWNADTIALSDLERVELQTEESIRTLSSAAGWAAAGLVLGGPVGAVLGGLWGGRGKKELCFAVYLKNGQKFLAVGTPEEYQRLAAAVF